MPTLRESIALSLDAMKQRRANAEAAHKIAIADIDTAIDTLSAGAKLITPEVDSFYAALVKLGLIPDITIDS